MKTLLLTLAALLAAAPTQASVLPPHRVQIPVITPWRQNVDEARFNAILAKLHATHAGYFTQMRAQLRIDSDWIDGTANAFAEREGDTYIIEAFGGLARHPMVTPDAFTLFLCHEMGHHLGGFPVGLPWGWPSFEGQSDYFASAKCLRRMFLDEDNAAALAGQTLDPALVQRCARAYPGKRLEQLICLRSGQAALSAVMFLYSFDRRGPTPSFAKPDPTVVNATLREHPQPACRLDTLVAGALCHADLRVNPDPANHGVGACSSAFDPEGARPACWFREPARRR